jgi:hypothetical protein
VRNPIDLTTSQLNNIIAIQAMIKALQGQNESIVASGDGDSPIPTIATKPHRHRFAAVRARMAAARVRWAGIKGTEAAGSKTAEKGKTQLNPAGGMAIFTDPKARLAMARGAEKPRLQNAAHAEVSQERVLRIGVCRSAKILDRPSPRFKWRRADLFRRRAVLGQQGVKSVMCRVSHACAIDRASS